MAEAKNGAKKRRSSGAGSSSTSGADDDFEEDPPGQKAKKARKPPESSGWIDKKGSSKGDKSAVFAPDHKEEVRPANFVWAKRKFPNNAKAAFYWPARKVRNHKRLCVCVCV